MVMGGIVPVVNLDGVAPGELVLDGADARQEHFSARSPNGTIPRSRSSTPPPSCRAQAIAVVHRSDGSGTTFNFTYYLSQGEPRLEVERRRRTAVEWPVGIGAKGNEGVANNVSQTKGRDRLRRIRLRQSRTS
jgi:phosphate transport system substrate-binding protein